jgi:hypothetical protein
MKVKVVSLALGEGMHNLIYDELNPDGSTRNRQCVPFYYRKDALKFRNALLSGECTKIADYLGRVSMLEA